MNLPPPVLLLRESEMVKKLFFLFLVICSLVSSNSDSDTLLAFKASSDLSNSLFSWSNSSHPCSGSWLGVTCNSNRNRVTRLVLESLNLTGSVQTLTLLDQLRILSLRNNNLSSGLNFSSWTNLKLLYLSYNHFSGNFPAGISQLQRLRRLYLSHNRLGGHIPISELRHLPHLLTLCLEGNSFNGTLHSPNEPYLSSSSSSSILDFNVSDNNLVGEIPGWVSSFSASSFGGNKNLCGKPLPTKCLNGNVQSNPIAVRVSDQGAKQVNDRVKLLIIVVDVAAVAMVVILMYCCYKRRSRLKVREVKRYTYDEERRSGVSEDKGMVFFAGFKSLTLDDLLKSSAEMLGKGCVGTTYKVVMECGNLNRVVVVKRMKERRTKREMEGLLRETGGLRHCNIVSLRAYYCDRDELLLIYDFLPNGSLHSLLHGNRGPGRTPLDWTTRLKLASGSAKGLAFLHGAGKCRLYHGHLTSLNILVDQVGNACISDIAVHQLLLMPQPSNNGYKAPELMLNNIITKQGKCFQKCDVYSFGVILLELLTGKMATEGETSLAKWVQQVVKEEWTWEVFDLELLRYKEMEEEMMSLLQVALLCLVPVPQDRPKMSVVHKMIEDIMVRGCRGGARIYSPSNGFSSDSSPSLSQETPNFTSSRS